MSSLCSYAGLGHKLSTEQQAYVSQQTIRADQRPRLATIIAALDDKYRFEYLSSYKLHRRSFLRTTKFISIYLKTYEVQYVAGLMF